MRKLSSLDLWRLADTLSVVDAAILICGGDPAEHSFDNEGDRIKHTWQHDGYDAAFSALRGAILSNKLSADVRHSMRGHRYSHVGYEEPYEITNLPSEDQISYDLLVARNDTSNSATGYGGSSVNIDGHTTLNFSVDTIRSERFLYICKEPNWEQTTIDIDALKAWLKRRGVFPEFFFRAENIEGFRNREHARYTPKLACAVAAWENVTRPGKNNSVKQTLQDWAQSNGVNFGLGDSGVVSPTAAAEIAKIANWDTKGGATATHTKAEEEGCSNLPDEPVNNYKYGYPENFEDDSEIPF
ncbi:hypothetical protein Q8W33_10670 [Shimia thalassica]|nr:hypothetical protein [Shimia thalassica]